MRNNIQEVTTLRITIEREKLARDEKSIQKILEILEEYEIPCECITIYVDYLAIVIRSSEYEKFERCKGALQQSLGQISISADRDMILLCMEREQITCRGIGIIISSLTMQNIEVKMHRYLQCRDHFIVGVSPDAVEKAREIIAQIIDSHYQI